MNRNALPIHPFFLVLLAACGGEPMNIEMARPDAEEVLPETTNGLIAMRNLDFRIDAAERILSSAEDPRTRAELISLLAQRARFRGTFSDYDQAQTMSAEMLEAFPEERRAVLSRASVLAGLHRFDEAHELLAQVDGSEDAIEAARLPMWIASGEPGPFVERARDRVVSTPSLASWITLASALAARGLFDEAEAAFLAAAASYNDVSPFAIAWLQFQRGVMWSERAGDVLRGQQLYEDAVRRLPAYVTAQVHLAEIERLHSPADAIERLEGIVNETEDPEPMGLLGELLLEVGRTRDGRVWVERADSLYVSLLARHRAAFADHGAEFYLRSGAQPELAFELARDNLVLRKTERAYALAIRAALAAQRSNEACVWAREAEARAHSGVELLTVLPEALGACS